MEHRRETGLRIASAAAVQSAVPQLRNERLARHAFDARRVAVRFEYETPAGDAAIESSDGIRAPGQNLLLERLEAVVPKEPEHVRLDLLFGASVSIRRIHAIDANEVGKCFDQFCAAHALLLSRSL